jgi:hypothetical protein
MKLRVISLMALVMAGSVSAEEVRLFCAGTTPVADEFGSVSNMNVTGEMRFDEEAGTMHYARKGKFKKAKDVEFTDSHIKGKVSGDLRSGGQSIKIALNRYTGIVTTDLVFGSDSTLQCERVANERKF